MYIILPAFREIVSNLLFVLIFYKTSDLNEAPGLLGDFTDHSLLDASWKNNCHDSSLDSPSKNPTAYLRRLHHLQLMCCVLLLMWCWFKRCSECCGVGGRRKPRPVLERWLFVDSTNSNRSVKKSNVPSLELALSLVWADWLLTYIGLLLLSNLMWIILLNSHNSPIIIPILLTRKHLEIKQLD